MTVRIGTHEFDHVSYDAKGDVLYLHRGDPRPAAETFGTPEGRERIETPADELALALAADS